MISIGYYIKALLSLGAILGILYAILRVSKLAHKRQYLGEMKVIDQLPLDTNVRLVIVQVRDHQLLLSISSKEVQVLEKLS